MSETDTQLQFDLSLAAEAGEIETIKVEVKPGVFIDFPVIDEWPIEANQMLQDGRLNDVLDLLFADDSEGRAVLRGIKVKQLRTLMEHLAKLAGAAPGEGSGSAS